MEELSSSGLVRELALSLAFFELPVGTTSTSSDLETVPFKEKKRISVGVLGISWNHRGGGGGGGGRGMLLKHTPNTLSTCQHPRRFK